MGNFMFPYWMRQAPKPRELHLSRGPTGVFILGSRRTEVAKSLGRRFWTDGAMEHRQPITEKFIFRRPDIFIALEKRETTRDCPRSPNPSPGQSREQRHSCKLSLQKC